MSTTGDGGLHVVVVHRYARERIASPTKRPIARDRLSLNAALRMLAEPKAEEEGRPGEDGRVGAALLWRIVPGATARLITYVIQMLERVHTPHLVPTESYEDRFSCEGRCV